MRCSKCNYPVLPKFEKCPKCGEPLKNTTAKESSNPVEVKNFDFDSKPQPSKPVSFDFDSVESKSINETPSPEKEQLSVLNGKVIWNLAPGEIARHITPDEMARCEAARGVVVQDGVTAAVFVDGSLAIVLDGGIYRFGNEKVKVEGKTKIVTPRNEVVTPVDQTPVEQSPAKDTRNFFQKMFDAVKVGKKKTPDRPAVENQQKLEEKRRKEEERRRIMAEKARKTVEEKTKGSQPVVSVYLLSDRIFEIAFGKENGEGRYMPFRIKAAFNDIEIGVRMQMCVTDFETFRQNYLIDHDKVSIGTLQRLMSPWVNDILKHSFEKTDVSDGLSADDEKRIIDKMLEMLQSRLFGIEIVNIYDFLITNEALEALKGREAELWQAEKEAALNHRENEFRNRVALMESQIALDWKKISDQTNLGEKELEDLYRKKLLELNRDEILTQDEFDKFVEIHEVETSLRKAALYADEQTRRYETDKILAELEKRQILDRDQFDALKESVENGRFEREQVNDILRAKALAKSTIEKLKLENETALAQKDAQHSLDIRDKQFQIEDLDIEQQIYGRQYALEKQKAADALEMESLALDAQIIRMRKEDEYADERYNVNKAREHDEWEEQFLRDSRTFDRSLEQKKKEFDFDFERKTREAEFDFDRKTREAEFDFDLESRRSDRDFEIKSRQATFDFDLDQKRADADTERAIRLDSHAQDMADREHQRAMEDKRLEQEALRLKGNIAMENMKAMMEAKRAQRQDELQADVDKLNIRSQMSAEQLASEQLSSLDAEAQKAYMDAMREKHSSSHENEALKREMEARREMQEQSRNDMKEMMAQMMAMTQQSNQQFADLAKNSMNANAEIAKARAEAETGAANRRAQDLERDNARYREDARFAQTRLDQTQRESLEYTTRQTNDASQNNPAPADEDKPQTVRLNTAWLREHNFNGSFNELAGMLSSMGAEIGRDFDDNGNPVIVVEGLLTGQVMKVLQDCGVEF